jgi:hypothetical protein
MSRSFRIAPLLMLVLAAPALAQTSMAAMNGMGGSSTTADTAQLTRVKAALEKYRDPIVAVRDGYFSTLACVEYPQGEAGAMGYRPGGMGVHFLNMNNVGPQLDTLRPQVLIYQPIGDSLHLVAAEWFMPAQLAAQAPQIFGRALDGPMEGHAPIMPAEFHHWDLHVWLWKNNPNGVFHPTNPTVTCPPRGRYTVRGAPPRIVSQ